MPCISAPSPYTSAEAALTAVMIPTNTADPIEPAIVRSEVRSEEASAIFVGCTFPVPQVRSGIIRLPIEIFRITLSTAAVQRGVSMVRKYIPILLTISAADPATKIFLIPILSYKLPANGLAMAVARNPGRVTRPEVTAEYPITLWT